MVINTNSFAKTICSICYEDLKPIVEDLQAISICGHVFHELCLQQWFEYCSKSRKCSCPVCKQSCTGINVARLYFQSLGDQNEPFMSQKVIDCKEDPELLRGEVRRLEVKVSGLTSNLERQGKEIQKLNEELCICKDQVKKEVILRNDAMEQKTSTQQLLVSKSEELHSLKLECLRLQDRNMALAKELAALKLVSDPNLDEDEILKLASFGNETNNKDTVDVLRKSLVIRNMSYKELMAKCNQLGRGEARSSKKLEKAKEKIKKLKTKVKELEMMVEEKDNAALRALKASTTIDCKEDAVNDINVNSDDFFTSPDFSEDQKEKLHKSVIKLDGTGTLNSDQGNFNIIKNVGASSTKERTSTTGLIKEINTCFIIDEVISDTDSRHQISEDMKSALPKSKAISNINSKAKVDGPANPGGFSGTSPCINRDNGNTLSASTEEEVTLVLDDVKHVQPMLKIKKEASTLVPVSSPGNICFSGGLLAPDGSNRYLGKWCKRGQSKGSLALQGTSASGSGDLIAVGSDGRGGRIKVLKSLNSSSLENSATAKRCKYGTKASISQSQGCLQIEHFFGKATH